MSDAYRLHCFAQSGNAYKVALMLQLSGLDWEPVFVDFFNGGARTPEFLALNPMGEAPVLEGPDFAQTQSGAILSALAATTGLFTGQSKEEWTEILRWMFWDNHKLNQLRRDLPVHDQLHARRAARRSGDRVLRGTVQNGAEGA